MSDEPHASEENDSGETLSASFSVTISDWEDSNEEAARAYGAGVMALTKELSKLLDLSDLEAIVISWNYREALAGVERGEGMPAAVPTSNEYGQGGAMAVHVVRGDELKNVVVFWMGLVRHLLDPRHTERATALMTLVHELVHVEDLRLFCRTYPGGWRSAKFRDGREAALVNIVHHCQLEYSAQRRSAWAAPGYGLDLLEMLGRAMVDVEEQIRAARIAYRLHGDMSVYWPIVAERTTFLFNSLGYALGHADWLAAHADEHPELARLAAEKVCELEQLPIGWMIGACREAVQPFFELEAWTGPAIYEPLIAVLERLLNENGMYTRPDGDKLYVDMPFTGLHDL